jgi:hypothetical protein
MRDKKLMCNLYSLTNPQLNYCFEIKLNKARVSLKENIYIFQATKKDEIKITIKFIDDPYKDLKVTDYTIELRD